MKHCAKNGTRLAEDATAKLIIVLRNEIMKNLHWLILFLLLFASSVFADIRSNAGDFDCGTLFNTNSYTTGRNQTLIPAELIRYSLDSNTITGLTLTMEDVTPRAFARWRISMMNTSLHEADALTFQPLSQLTEVFESTDIVTRFYDINITFQTPFVWDGHSNLLIDFGWETDAALGINTNIAGAWTTAGGRMLVNAAFGYSGVNEDLVTPFGRYQAVPRYILQGVNYLAPDFGIGQHSSNGDMIVPFGSHWRAEPGFSLSMDDGTEFYIYGNAEFAGQPGDSIFFEFAGWSSIRVKEGGSLDAQYCNISGGGIAASDASLHLEHSWIHHSRGFGLYCSGNELCDASVKELRISSCDIAWYNAALAITGMTQIELSRVILDHNYGNTKPVLVRCGLPVLLDRLTVMDNSNGYESWIQTRGTRNTLIRNSILWQPGVPLLEARNSSQLILQNCVVSDNGESAEGNVVLSSGNLFTEPEMYTDGSYRPWYDSEVIDAGYPYSEPDPDGTRADIGAVYDDQSSPRFEDSADVPDDQGRQVQIVWESSSLDRTQVNPDWFYSVWRLDDNYGQVDRAATVYHSLNEAAAEAARVAGQGVLVQDVAIDGSRDDVPVVLTFLTEVPCVQLDYYSVTVPSAVDGLATFYVVFWHGPGEPVNTAGQATSYDNLAPDAVSSVALAPRDTETLRLHWDEVSTGTASDGTRLPELNGVWYKVYHCDQPYFDLDEGTLLGVVDSPELLLPMPSGNMRAFYRIVAVDVLK